MKRSIILALFFILALLFAGCFGVGKVHTDAAAEVTTKITEKYPEEVAEIKVYRDKLQIAFKTDVHIMKKASIFQEAAVLWYTAYPEDKKPIYKMYCYAYDEVISDDDIGSLQMVKGKSPSMPKIFGEPGIYKIRDVK